MPLRKECLMILQPHNISTIAEMLLRKLGMVRKPERQRKFDTTMKSESQLMLSMTVKLEGR